MKVARRCSCAATVLAALLGLAASAIGQVAGTGAADAADVPDEAPVEVPAGPSIETLGNGVSTIHVVDHGDSWSMHVESIPTDQLLGLWQQAGGPEMVAKTVVDRPYTLSVHRLSAERILERLFDGYDYTLHYDRAGRLVRVRVYSLDPAAAFKTPRLVESLRDWNEKETPDGADSGTPTDAGKAAGE